MGEETRAKKSGLSADIQKKLNSKYSVESEQQCRSWIEEVLGDKLCDQEIGMHSFQRCLKDGQVLCRLINKLQSGDEKTGPVKRINTMSAPFKQMENIEMFLKACAEYGLKPGDLFQTADLYDCQNMSQVLGNLFALSTVATSMHGYEGPCIGTKLADENVREFDQATLDAGKAVLTGQTGWNKGETQKGMNMGKTRKVVDM